MAGRWKRRLAIVATASFVGFAGLEANLRIFGGPIEIFNPLNGFHEGDPVLGWRGKKNVARRFHTAEFDVLVRHDEEGFRAPDPPRPADAEHRLLILGDSLGWGWGVPQGRLFSDHLQRALPDVAVYNRSVNAFSTAQELLLLRRETGRRDFDLLLVLVSRTDLDENTDDKEHRPAFDLEGDRLVPRNQPPPGALKHPIERFIDDHSHAVNFLSWQLAALKAWIGRRSAAPASTTASAAGAAPLRAPDLPGWAVTDRLLREIAATCRREAMVLIFAYATTWLERRREPVEADFRDLVARIAAEEGARFIDLNEALEDAGHENVLLAGDGHWSEAGHRTVASTLLESGLLRP